MLEIAALLFMLDCCMLQQAAQLEPPAFRYSHIRRSVQIQPYNSSMDFEASPFPNVVPFARPESQRPSMQFQSSPYSLHV